ncbi:MAG TPA: MBL fold metallo-hydrolase [Gammaproteobacteria bacterium]
MVGHAALRRRELLSALSAALLAQAAAPLARAQHAGAPAPRLEWSDLGDGAGVVAGAGANVVVVPTTAGLVMVDGGLAARSPALLELIARRFPGEPVRMLFNTNWRPEHTGSNEALSAAGARILAHENTKLWIGGDFFVPWENRHYPPRPRAAWPTETFYVSGETALGGEPIRYEYLPRAHTDGDVAVLFPERNLLVASDLLAVDRYPIPDYATGGWIRGLEEATAALLELSDEETRIVPAHGPVATRAALEAQLTLCETVSEGIAAALRRGASLEDFRAMKPTAEFDARYGDPELFLALVYKGALGHVRELGGII